MNRLIVVWSFGAAAMFPAAPKAAELPAGIRWSKTVGGQIPAGAIALGREAVKGIVVNSSVLGVVILALSLAFFYLYLVYVYPIQNVI